MLKDYAKPMLVASLLTIILTSSGCYTVLKMQTVAISHPNCDYLGVYDDSYDWYDPFFSYYPYYSYASVGWWYSPWTYWCRDPYWSYPYYWRTRSSPYNPYTSVPRTWHKGERRRGFDTTSTPLQHTSSTPVVRSRDTFNGEPGDVKKLRKVGTNPASKPVRRSGMTPTPSPSSGTSTPATPTVTRQRPAASSSSSASRTKSSSTSTRRRGSRR